MVPAELLPVLLAQLFPVVSGPHELDRVDEVLAERGGEFVASLRSDPEMVAASCRRGYLPMSEDFTGHEVLLIKVHEQRMVLELPELHVSRSTRRRARGLELRIDAGFDRCLQAIVVYHPERWLTAPLCDALCELNRRPRAGVGTHSVEVYARGELVAGEVGYTCGAAYTSMAAFHTMSGAGSVQLAVLGVLLREAGFAFWDLGMEMEYKLALGARTVGRDAFLRRYRTVASEPTPALPSGAACGPVLARARGS